MPCHAEKLNHSTEAIKMRMSNELQNEVSLISVCVFIWLSDGCSAHNLFSDSLVLLRFGTII